MPDLRPPFPHPSTTQPLLPLHLSLQAAPFVPPSLHEQFTKALSSPHLCSIITATAAEISIESKNWSTEWFEEITLAQRDVVSNTIRLATVVEGKGGGGLGGVLSRAAAWGCQLEAEGEGEKEGIGWQVRRFWRGFRLPGEAIDVLAGPWENAKPPLSGAPVGNSDGEGYNEGNVNAIAWRNGRAHTLRIIQNGKPVRGSDIRRQLDYITSLPASPPKDGEANIALLSWRYDRTFWSQLHSQLLTHAPNLPAFKKLYNSALSIALDSAPVAPSPDEGEDGLARLLDEVRHGKYSPNRHADVTFNIVSFGYGEEGKGEGDGKIGLAFDHTPADCGAAMELSKILASPIVPEGEIVVEECNFIPERLEFTFPPGTKLDIPDSVQEKIPREVRILTLNTAGRSYVSGGLVDVCLNLALQSTMESSSTNGHQTWPVIYQPVSQPNCYKGRCGPGCCTTTESITFLSSLFPSSPSSPSSSSSCEEDENLIPAFEKYLSRRRDVISAARTATPAGVFTMHKLYPALISAIEAGDQRPDVRVAKKVLEKLESEVQFTGFTIDKNEVVAGVSNVFVPDQLVLFYLQKPNSCAVTFSATGRYIPQLPDILQRFESRWEVIARFLDGYAQVHRKSVRTGKES